MPIIVAVQTSIAGDGALPRDAAINTWHLLKDSAWTGTDTTNTVSAFDYFFNTVKNHFSPTIANTGHWIKGYNLADPKPRVPIFSTALADFNTSATYSAPREVALCVSYKATPASGEHPRRRRGRWYMGPLGEGTLQTADGRPSSAEQQFWVDAVHALWATLYSSTPQLELVGYSPKDGASWRITEMWADNEWDTQRRRGGRATSRYSRTLVY